MRSASPYQLKRCSDQELILSLDRRIFPADHRVRIDTGGAYWTAVHEDDRHVGFCAIYPVWGEPGVCFLARAGVLKAHQGNGLQKRMISVRERWAIANGYRYIITYTQSTNFPSATSLIKKGFRFYKPAYPWGCKNSLYFVKNLQELL